MVIFLKTIYTCPPLEYPVPLNMVCKLKKTIYGLKQSPRARFFKLKGVLHKARYRQSRNGHSLFISFTSNRTTFALIYVDDILITGNDRQGIQKFKNILQTLFR